MKKIKKLLMSIGLIGFSLTAFAEEKNNGQDVTKPLTRFDIRTSYTDGIEIPGQDDAYSSTIIARIDKPMPMGKSGWIFYYRTDIPFVISDVPSADNLTGDDSFGTGDWFHQFVFIAPGKKSYPLNIQTFGIGFQTILPTASEDQFGAGRFAFAPLFAWKWKLSKNIDFIPIFKYRQSVGGSLGDTYRNEVSRFEFKPQINWAFAPDWFLTLYETADITLQRSDDSQYEDDWSVPVDVMIGKTFDKGLFGVGQRSVVSLNAIAYIVDDYKTSDYTVQFRYGMFF